MKYLVIVLALTVTLLWTGTATAQYCSGPGPCGPGEGIPVFDTKANNANYWILQIVRTLEILRDHILQGKLGDIAANDNTTEYLKEQAAERYGEAVTYGSGSSETWPDTFTFDHVWEEGGWLDSDLETERRALDTQRTMLRLLEKRQEEFLAEEESIGVTSDAINGAQGRNQLLAAIGGIQGKHLQQSRKEQQLLMTIANSLLVGQALESNRIVKRQAQERAFFNNFNKPVAFPEFTDRGL